MVSTKAKVDFMQKKKTYERRILVDSYLFVFCFFFGLHNFTIVTRFPKLSIRFPIPDSQLSLCLSLTRTRIPIVLGFQVLAISWWHFKRDLKKLMLAKVSRK